MMLVSSVTWASTPPLKCLSFNLLHGGVFSGLVGNAQDINHRFTMVVEELRSLEVDLLGLQEASASWGRGNVAERLARELGFHYVYAPASFRLFPSEAVNTLASWVMNFSEGPAIVSRFPITSWRAYDLPRCGRFTDSRVFLYAEVQTPWGPLHVGSTHISGNPCQAQNVAELLRELDASSPLLVMGDFNALEHSSAMTTLIGSANLIDTFRLMNPTALGSTVWQRVDVPTPMASRRVDYLLLRPGSGIVSRVEASRVVLNRPQKLADGRTLWPSDHYGILTEIVLEPPRR